MIDNKDFKKVHGVFKPKNERKCLDTINKICFNVPSLPDSIWPFYILSTVPHILFDLSNCDILQFKFIYAWWH